MSLTCLAIDCRSVHFARPFCSKRNVTRLIRAREFIVLHLSVVRTHSPRRSSRTTNVACIVFIPFRSDYLRRSIGVGAPPQGFVHTVLERREGFPLAENGVRHLEILGGNWPRKPSRSNRLSHRIEPVGDVVMSGR
ncbi:MAG: hypothetical protein JWM16_2324 [Verrucomicrobiales bacterium]|nr:hypothetical protein [Verrucomicrobiales bacterium]